MLTGHHGLGEAELVCEIDAGGVGCPLLVASVSTDKHSSLEGGKVTMRAARPSARGEGDTVEVVTSSFLGFQRHVLSPRVVINDRDITSFEQIEVDILLVKASIEGLDLGGF